MNWNIFVEPDTSQLQWVSLKTSKKDTKDIALCKLVLVFIKLLKIVVNDFGGKKPVSCSVFVLTEQIANGVQSIHSKKHSKRCVYLAGVLSISFVRFVKLMLKVFIPSYLSILNTVSMCPLPSYRFLNQDIYSINQSFGILIKYPKRV